MTALWLLLAWIALIAWAATACAWLLGVRRMAVLGELPDTPMEGAGTTVSAVVPARNEERWIEEALSSLLAQDAPGLEVIAVDDRSTDRTSEILRGLASRHPNLRVLTVRELPDGWLGKNHALWIGAREARGDWLLFADADVGFDPSCLHRALTYAKRRRLDHLALFPDFRAEGLLYRSFVLAFAILFWLYSRPWRAADPDSRDHVGVGAFNLVRQRAYRAVGGHSAIRMRSDDDMQLGRILKEGGFRQEAAFGGGLLRIEWYPGLGEAIRGLEKNALAPSGYRPSLTLASCGLVFATQVLPPLGAVAAGGWPALLFLLATALMVWTAGDEARRFRFPRWHGLLHPLGASLVLWAVARAAALAWARGGIAWRGTTYPLEKIRREGKNRGRKRYSPPRG